MLKNNNNRRMALVGNDAGGNEIYRNLPVEFSNSFKDVMLVDPKEARSEKLARLFQNRFDTLNTVVPYKDFAQNLVPILREKENILFTVDSNSAINHGIQQRFPKMTAQIAASIPTNLGQKFTAFQVTVFDEDEETRKQASMLFDYFSNISEESSSREFERSNFIAKDMLNHQRNIASKRSIEHLMVKEKDPAALITPTITMVSGDRLLPLVVDYSSENNWKHKKEQALSMRLNDSFLKQNYGKYQVVLLDPKNDNIDFIKLRANSQGKRFVEGVSTFNKQLEERVNRVQIQQQPNFTD